ncbi:MAG: MFS transporter [Candidatus Levyibacteriota bacterium]
MEQTRKLVHHDISKFDHLAEPARKLLFSITIYNVIFPIFTIFINAFLWRESHNLTLLVIYNLVLYVALPIGFYVNGLLLQTFAAKKLLSVGLIVFGISVSVIIFQTSISYLAAAIFGLLNGFYAGIYWGNRNFLTIETTTSENRIYFSGLESMSLLITGILIPIIVGHFITFGTTFHLYSTHVAYKILAVLMLYVIVMIALVVLHITKTYEKPHTVLVRHPSKLWTKIRWIQFLYGAVSILQSFFPIVLVLYLLGQEDTLGVLQSISAAITAFIVYFVAKSLDTRHRVSLVRISFITALLGIGFFSIFYNTAIGIFIYLAAVSFMMPLLWIALHSLNFDAIDKEDIQNQTHYAFITDQEIFLNLGRIVSLASFLLLLIVFSDKVALRYLPFLLTILHGFLLILTKSIEKKLNQSN